MEQTEYFDYRSVAKEMSVPEEIVVKIEEDVKEEFPNDKMMYELHVLRALKSRYWERSGNATKQSAVPH